MTTQIVEKRNVWWNRTKHLCIKVSQHKTNKQTNKKDKSNIKSTMKFFWFCCYCCFVSRLFSISSTDVSFLSFSLCVSLSLILSISLSKFPISHLTKHKSFMEYPIISWDSMRLYPYMHFYIYHITWLLLLRIVLIISSCSFHYYPFLFLVLIFVNLCVRGLLYLIKFWHVRLIILSFWTFDWAKRLSHIFFLIRSLYLYFLMPSLNCTLIFHGNDDEWTFPS